jgi:inosose dehydratase
MKPNNFDRPLDRRAFIGRTAAGALALGLASSARGAKPTDGDSLAITLGMSLYGMRDLKLDEAFAACAKIGYNAVELACLPDWPGDPDGLDAAARKTIAAKLESHGLVLPALMENLKLGVDEDVQRRQLDRLKQLSDLGHDLSPDDEPVIETVLGGKVGEWDSVKSRFAKQLAAWAEVGEDTKTVIAIKPHRGGALNTPADAIWLLERVKSPWIRLVYDFSHYEHRDYSVDETLDQLLPWTVFIHVKDTVLDGKNVRFALPGEGQVDYEAMLEKVEEEGYRGSICVEVSSQVQKLPGYDPIAAARKSYAKLAPAFAAAGISLPAPPGA